MRLSLLASLLFLAVGCPYISDDEAIERRDLDGDGIAAVGAGGEDCDDGDASVGLLEWFADSDGDGFGDADSSVLACEAPDDSYVDNADDCDDTAATVYPDAPELCNSIDDDCDGDVDLGASQTWYFDGDGDGYGNVDDTFDSCEAPSGFVDNALDCDDADALVRPDGVELCNGIDDDCDGLTDDEDTVSAPPAWYDDLDGDGFGDPASQVLACTAPAGTIAVGGDCDDTTSAVKPGQAEVCNGVDDDCDGLTDDDDTGVSGKVDWFGDGDSDGFGVASDVVNACSAPGGYTGDTGDCDDADATVNPNASELCDGIDNDCDGTVDEASAIDAVSFYVDSDGDGYGSTAASTAACNAPAGFAPNALDCDDTSALVNPDVPELCDGVDNNCDGVVDTDAAAVDWYADADLDGFGDAGDAVSDCAPQTGRVLDATDCDDSDAGVNPAGSEVCNGVDDDCDGDVDDADPDVQGLSWYADADADGFGLASSTQSACVQPAGHAPDPGDCDDGDAAVNPGADELCNGVDDDCDGDTDDADSFVLDAADWYTDADADGFGDLATSTRSCAQPGGTIATGGDCDDTDPAVNPSATEVCDGIDNDCDFTDDGAGAVDALTWYADVDSDGFGDAADSELDCVQPDDYVADDTDCDDAAALVYPGAPEICDGIDNNCNSLIDDGALPVDWYLDADLDGFGDASDTIASCSQPAGYVLADTDCNDADPSISPAAPEVCNGGVDDDCDGDADDADPDVTDPVTWYIDSDADGFGAPGATTSACLEPVGFSADPSDCNDGDAAVNPSALEVCDSIDNDCDTDIDDSDADVTGQPTWYRDFDGDTYGDPATDIDACVAPGSYIADSQDCDDGDVAVNPAATEICDGFDNNCNGDIDDADGGVSGEPDWYLDADADGYGDAGEVATACTAPVGYLSDDTDCDDGDPNTYPTAPEICDGVDNNCNSLVDDGVSTVTWYADTDTDGYGDALNTQDSCAQPAGFIANSTDCNDADANIHPTATEVCNGVDDDCDGATDGADPGLVGGFPIYPDADGDNHGDAAGAINACSVLPGYVSVDTDCDDSNSAVNPDQVEVCKDGLDNDCDGTPNTCLGLAGDLVEGDAGAAIFGDTDDMEFGGAFSTAGDVDGDGTDDVWGSASQHNGAAGAVVLFNGPLSGTEVASNGALFIRGTVDYEFGHSLLGADLDSDGAPDLVVGSPKDDDDGKNAGAVQFYSDPFTTGPTSSDDTSARLVAENKNHSLGESVSTGDFNGDGIADLLMGAPGWDGAGLKNAGSAYVVYGPAITDMGVGSADAILRGRAANASAGLRVASAGDTDGDGVDDLLIASPRYPDGGPRDQAGQVALMLGAPPSFHSLATADGLFSGEGAGDQAGSSVAGAGDVDGDGLDDMIIGAHRHGGSGVDAGAAYLLLGGTTGSLGLGSAEAKLNGVGGDRVGEAAAGLGDLDQDGFADVVVGSSRGNGNDGAAWVLRGPFSGTSAIDSTASARILGEGGAGDRLGASVGSPGDVDGDGCPDVMVGAPRDASAADRGGALFLYYSIGGL